MFAKFYEIPSMILQDIMETKRYGHTFGRSDGQRKTVYPPTNTVCGGIKKQIFSIQHALFFLSLDRIIILVFKFEILGFSQYLWRFESGLVRNPEDNFLETELISNHSPMFLCQVQVHPSISCIHKFNTFSFLPLTQSVKTISAML